MTTHRSETQRVLSAETIDEIMRLSGGVRPSSNWLRLYCDGLVHPPYKGKANRKRFAELAPPIDVSWSNDDLLQALGRLASMSSRHSTERLTLCAERA